MKKLAPLTLMLSLVLSSNAFAAKNETKNDNEFKELKTNLVKFNPTMPQVDSIKKTEVPGIYEVIVNKSEIFYTDKTGKFIFIGHLLKLNKDKNGNYDNITEEKIKILTKLEFSTLDFKNAIVRKYGEGKDKIVTFEDPNCGFCKKLTVELEQLKNATVYTYVVPILGKSSVDVTEKIWCSKDRSAAWQDYMLKTITPKIDEKDLASCNKDGIKENIDLFNKLKLKGTPAIYFENGTSFKGYVKIDKLQESLK